MWRRLCQVSQGSPTVQLYESTPYGNCNDGFCGALVTIDVVFEAESQSRRLGYLNLSLGFIVNMNSVDCLLSSLGLCFSQA